MKEPSTIKSYTGNSSRTNTSHSCLDNQKSGADSRFVFYGCREIESKRRNERIGIGSGFGRRNGLHQLRQRAVWARLQHLEASGANSQAAEDTSISDFAVKLLAGHAWKRMPDIVGGGHRPMVLVASKVELVQRRRDRLNIGGCPWPIVFLTRHGLNRCAVAIQFRFGFGNEVFQWLIYLRAWHHSVRILLTRRRSPLHRNRGYWRTIGLICP